MAAKKTSKSKVVKGTKGAVGEMQTDPAPTVWRDHPLVGMITPPPEKRRMPWFGWVGLAIFVTSEVLLLAGNHPVAVAFTAIMWTGYVPFLDGLIWTRGGFSYFIDRKREWPMLFLISILIWSMFEVIDLKTDSWGYRNIPPPGVREFLAAWAYGTIIPALFRTWDLFATFKAFEKFPKFRLNLTPFKLAFSFLIGVACIGLPLLMSDKWANFLIPCIWLGFIFLVEPVNYLLNIPRISIFRELEQGNSMLFWHLLAAGMFCGILWESLNWQAKSAGGQYWYYHLAGFWEAMGFYKHWGEMPLAGFGGYPPFIWELFVIYELIKYVMQGDKMWRSDRA